MALGDGCWGPGIHWDAENSAALTGPRAGAWPYSGGCTVAARSGLHADTNTNQLWVPPPMGSSPLSGTWNQSSSGAVPGPNYVLPVGWNQILGNMVPGPVSGVGIPSYSCGTPGFQEQAVLTLDMLLGTGSYGYVGSDQIASGAGYILEYQNKLAVPTVGSTFHANTGSPLLNIFSSAPNFLDDPWGLPAVGSTGAFTGSMQMSGTNSGWGYTTGWSMPTSFTVMVWVKPRVVAATGGYTMGGTVFSIDGNNAPLMSVGQPAGNGAQWLFLNASSDVLTPGYSTWTLGTQTLGAWQHLALVVNNTSWTLYVNGSSVGSATITRWTPLRIELGALDPANNASSNFLDGQLANFMIYGSALTATQVQNNYNNPLSPTSGATSWWPLNDASAMQRITRTVTVPRSYLYSGGNPYGLFRVYNDIGSRNNHVIVGWSVQVDSAFYTPTQTTAV